MGNNKNAINRQLTWHHCWVVLWLGIRCKRHQGNWNYETTSQLLGLRRLCWCFWCQRAFQTHTPHSFVPHEILHCGFLGLCTYFLVQISLQKRRPRTCRWFVENSRKPWKEKPGGHLQIFRLLLWEGACPRSLNSSQQRCQCRYYERAWRYCSGWLCW